MVVVEMGWKGVDLIRLAQDWVQWRAFMKTVMNARFRLRV